MATILVDYENVSGSNGLKGVDVLCEEDTLIIFFSDSCRKIRYDYLQDIKESKCTFRVIRLKEACKNALDFYIAAECGVISERGEKQIAIISNDKGFRAVIDFFQMDEKAANVQIVKAGNIENALILFDIAEDSKRKEIILSRKSLVDLASECARIEEQQKMIQQLEMLLKGTDYEQRSAEIIEFISEKKHLGKKALYTGSLHQFGRRDGCEIYKLLKNKLDSEEIIHAV